MRDGVGSKALITGVSGQDGSYLAELLLGKGYEVHGIVRRSSLFNRGRIEHLHSDSKLILHYGDMTDSSNLNRIIEVVRPDEIYNLAAQSHVHVSFEMPEYTAEADGVGTLRLLDAIRFSGLKTRFYQASTSELFGKVSTVPQNEKTPFYPRSPYGAAKLYAYWIVVNYREAYGLHASNGILFNHESPRRGENFVTRKITMGAARVRAGSDQVLTVGNLDALRDWGYAPDYVQAMWMMLQQPEPRDLVVATGEAHSVREFIELAFRHVGFDVVWRGKGAEEKGYDRKTDRLLVAVDPRFYRPAEVERLLGDPTLAKKVLGWSPSVTFRELVRIMIQADCERLGVSMEGTTQDLRADGRSASR